MTPVEFNKTLEIDRYQWQWFQMIIGARPDGMPGRGTAADLAIWQRRHGMPDHGRLDDATREAIDAIDAPWGSLKRVSLYWDRPAVWTLDRGERLMALLSGRVDVIKVMLTPSDGHTFKPSWSRSQLRDLRALAGDHGIKLELTAWALPHHALLSGMQEKIGRYIEAAGAKRFELDAEEHLLPRRVREYGDRAQLMSDLVAVMDNARKAGALAGVSTYADLFGKSDTWHAELMSKGDFNSLQAYQTEGGNGGLYDRSGPALKQYDSLERYRARVSPRPDLLAVAVALWDQDWEENGGSIAQIRSVEQCLFSGVREIDLWSAKHWLAPNADPVKERYNTHFIERMKFLREGAKDAGQGKG